MAADKNVTQARDDSRCSGINQKVAHAAFPKGNPYLTLSGELGTIFKDEDFIDLFPEKGLFKERGQQRTDATRVLAVIRIMNRLEMVAETLRATLNALVAAVPVWLRQVAPADWYERYGRRIEEYRLSTSEEKRAAYAQQVGEDAFQLLDLLRQADAPQEGTSLAEVATTRLIWTRHYSRDEDKTEGSSPGPVRFKPIGNWTGYMVHITETCEADNIHLFTHVETTEATVHESQKTETIHQALVEKGLAPGHYIVDSAYIDADLLVGSQEFEIDLIGPTRYNNSWQSKVDGAHDLEQFAIDCENQSVQCPQGKPSSNWKEEIDNTGAPLIFV